MVKFKTQYEDVTAAGNCVQSLRRASSGSHPFASSIILVTSSF